MEKETPQYPFEPLPGFALIQLSKKYSSGLTTDKEKYATNTRGILLKYVISADDFGVPGDFQFEQLVDVYGQAIGHEVYFAAFEDGEAMKDKVGGAEYVFVPIKSLRGYSNEVKL